MHTIDNKQEDILKRIEALQKQYKRLDEEKQKIRELALPLLGAALLQACNNDDVLKAKLVGVVELAKKKTKDKKTKSMLASFVGEETADDEDLLSLDDTKLEEQDQQDLAEATDYQNTHQADQATGF